MDRNEHFSKRAYAGLRALCATAFPKSCPDCGRVYRTAQAFVDATQAVAGGKSGLKQLTGDDGRVIVELSRRCACGSALGDFFGDRRNRSAAGLARRRRFGELADWLVSRGVAPRTAHAELLGALSGKTSKLLREQGPPPKAD